MLKGLAILAVFGALLFGGPDMPKNQHGTSRAEQNHSDSSEKVAPPTNGVTYAKDCCTTETAGKKDAPEEKPLPRFERPEWVIVYITAIYVFISAWMLIAIKKQAGQIEAQTAILRDSVAASQKSADAANSQIQFMKDKERARLEIEIDKFDYVPTVKPFFLQKVSWRVRLHGQSEATILKKRIIACIGEPDEHPVFNFGVYEMAIRNVMTPSERIAYGSTLIRPTSTTVDDVGTFDLDSLKDGKGILYCAGYITFKDVFGDVWTLPFKRKWAYERFGSDELDSEGWGGEWQQEGDNEERRGE